MEKVSNRQLTGIIVMILVSGIMMSGGASRSMQDSWIASALAAILAVPFFLMYARLADLFPGKGLFEIAYEVFGRFFGGIIVFLISFYAFHLGGMAMKNFSEFNMDVSMPETPQLVTLIMFGAATLYIIKKGIEVLGRFTDFFLPIMIFLILLMNVLSVGKMNFSNVLPVLKSKPEDFFSDVFSAFAFPVSEVSLAACLMGFKKNKTKTRKIFLYGLLVGGALLVAETLRSITVLGTHTIALTYYPSYVATGVINIMDFFTRIEVIVSAAFLFAQTVKVCVCVYVFSSGTGSILKSTDYRTLAVPTVLGMIALASVVFKNTPDTYKFLQIYKFFAPFFQIALPAVIFAGAQFYLKRERSLTAPI